VLCEQFFTSFKSSVKKRFVVFDKQCFKESKNVVVVRFGICKVFCSY
jgi:hypothetical protein